MGLFDYVNFKTTCPICHIQLDDFQSKDNNCMFNFLKPQDVNNFYSYCKKCGSWIEYNKDTKSEKYERIVRSYKKGKPKTLYEFTKLVEIKGET